MSELEKCMNRLEAIGKSFVQKSATYQSPKVAKACAITAATRTPEGAVLARRIMQLQRQEVIRKTYAPILKTMDLGDSQESDAFQKLESLQTEKMELIRSLNAGNQDSTAVKRLQRIYNREGDIVRSLIGED